MILEYYIIGAIIYVANKCGLFRIVNALSNRLVKKIDEAQTEYTYPIYFGFIVIINNVGLVRLPESITDENGTRDQVVWKHSAQNGVKDKRGNIIKWNVYPFILDIDDEKSFHLAFPCQKTEKKEQYVRYRQGELGRLWKDAKINKEVLTIDADHPDGSKEIININWNKKERRIIMDMLIVFRKYADQLD